MIFNEFEKEYLIHHIFNDLIENYQNFSIATKNGILGAIQYDNLIDEYGLYDLTNHSKNPSGNAFDGFERLRTYNHLFSSYIDLLIEKNNGTIYPSKEDFVKNLFIRGNYTLLNFSYSGNIVDVTFSDGEKGDMAIVGDDRDQKKIYTRIRKGLTVRLFDCYIDHQDAFFSGKHLYTMTLEKISDKNFENLFKASNFKFAHDEYNRYYEGDLNRFIKQMIKDGTDYDEEHLDEITNINPHILESKDKVFNDRDGFYFKDIETSQVMFVEETNTGFIPDIGLNVGDIITFKSMNIEIIDIIIHSYKATIILYKKVQK